MERLQEALDGLKSLGSPQEMRALAADGFGANVGVNVNVHIHLPPNFSAFESVEQAVGLAADEGVKILGVTNYYDYAVYGEFAAAARPAGIFPLFGLEIISLVGDLVENGVLINDPQNPGRMYVCGKGAIGIAAPSSRAAELLGTIRRNDTVRMREMTAKIARVFASSGLDTGFDDERVIDMIVKRHRVERETVTIQERHIAMAFQEELFMLVPADARARKLREILGTEPKAGPNAAVKIQGALRKHLLKSGRPAFVPESFLSTAEAIELILDLDAIPCYPVLADGADPVCAYEETPPALIERLREHGFQMVEFIPIRNTPEALVRYAKAIREAGIVVVAGTEHNTLDLLPIEPRCLKGAPVPRELKELFLEGARVIAAHQFLRLHGERGFVDERGRPNPDYDDTEERIRAFAGLGAAILQRYWRTSGQSSAGRLAT